MMKKVSASKMPAIDGDAGLPFHPHGLVSPLEYTRLPLFQSLCHAADEESLEARMAIVPWRNENGQRTEYIMMCRSNPENNMQLQV